jgi:hypothetical protein
MRRNLVVVLLLLIISNVALAQSADTCTGGTWIGHFNIGGTCKKTTMDTGTLDSFYAQIAAATASINAMPDQIKSAGPNGQSLSAAVSGASQLFGYVKWLFSASTAQELLGKTFAPIGSNILIIFTLVVAMTTIYVAINTVIFVVKMAVWAINQILKLIPFW